MVRTRNRIRKTAAQLGAAALILSSFGAAVVAAPSLFAMKTVAMHQAAVLQPLTAGPTLQLAKVGPGMSEDCVRVTRMIGPDGKEYPTNGVVCGGE